MKKCWKMSKIWSTWWEKNIVENCLKLGKNVIKMAKKFKQSIENHENDVEKCVKIEQNRGKVVEKDRKFDLKID